MKRNKRPADRLSSGRFRKGHSVGRATQFVKGQSGNPGGCPKYAELSRASRAQLSAEVPREELVRARLPRHLLGRTYAEAIAWVLGRHAINGSIAAAAELADRAEGRPHISLGVTDDTDPIRQLVEAMNHIGESAGEPCQDDETEAEADERAQRVN